MLAKLVSGGQTGVDRAALDIALELGLPCGGWCPQGRLAEDGPIPPHYPLIDTPSADYAERTLWNVRDSDATLVLNHGALDGGTALTIEHALALGRPFLIVDLDAQGDVAALHAWILAYQVRVLNVAGPRESKRAGIHARASAFLRKALSQGTTAQFLGARPLRTR